MVVKNAATFSGVFQETPARRKIAEKCSGGALRVSRRRLFPVPCGHGRRSVWVGFP